MRKLILASLLVVALACLTGASIAYAGDCGGCKTKCHSCKPKCDPCGETKCHSCKPKCDPCGETKCHSCKPKCNPCKPKCSPCKPKCNPCGEKKCNSCSHKCNSGCGNPCKHKCGSCGYVDPYANCFTTSSDLSAGGCCQGFGICRQACVTCETVCRRVESCDPCSGCTKVDYVYETVYHEIERPTVIPWWFNEKGDGNIYPDMNKDEAPAESGK